MEYQQRNRLRAQIGSVETGRRRLIELDGDPIVALIISVQAFEVKGNRRRPGQVNPQSEHLVSAIDGIGALDGQVDNTTRWRRPLIFASMANTPKETP